MAIPEYEPLPLLPSLYRPVVERALEEDLGLAGDITTAATVPADLEWSARLNAREAGRLAGLPVALDVFHRLDPFISIEVAKPEGSDLQPGDTVATLRGKARALLTGERTALNILTRLSGVATQTRRAVKAVGESHTRIVCTRKTTPTLRALEKYAVRVGGGVNHRFGLFDGVLIKDNHIAAAGGLRSAVERARAALGHMTKIEVEVDNLDQLAMLIDYKVDAVLLDNMKPDQLRAAVAMVHGRMLTEASGGIRIPDIPDYARAGVDLISLGWLTHSAPGLDLGLDFENSDGTGTSHPTGSN